MPNDTGVLGFGSKDKPSAGRWIDNVKEGRKRNLHIYLADQGGNENDQSYLGYFHDLNKVVACNFAISIAEDVVCIQTLKPGGKAEDVSIKKIPTSQFMDMLDLLVS